MAETREVPGRPGSGTSIRTQALYNLANLARTGGMPETVEEKKKRFWRKKEKPPAQPQKPVGSQDATSFYNRKSTESALKNE